MTKRYLSSRSIRDDSKRCERAATMVEYALLIALVALILIAGVSVLGTSVSTHFSTVGSVL